jgi:hypothetical protein
LGNLVLTSHRTLPRIEYMFDIGSGSGRSPNGYWETP